MSYFNISLDNDITYLLSEIGYNVHVNNIPAKAIINNTNNIEYDDKKITTHEELQRGYYVEYDNIYFLVISEVSSQRYNTYYKATMRRCNYDVKFIIDDKLYLFYSIIEGKNFTLEQNSYITTSADKITITLPDTSITRQLQLQDRIIKFNTAWQVEGMDFTRQGLIILHCKRDAINTSKDDIENEIANRYDNSKDRVNGNINHILPFDDIEEPEEPIEEPEEPIEEPEEPIEEPEEPIEEPEGNYTIVIEGSDTIQLLTTETYHATVYHNDTEIKDKAVVWELSRDDLVTIEQKDDTSIILNGYNNGWKTGELILKATLSDDETVYTEKAIYVRGF